MGWCVNCWVGQWVNGWGHVKSLKSNKSWPNWDNSVPDILDIFWTFHLNHLSPLWGYFSNCAWNFQHILNMLWKNVCVVNIINSSYSQQLVLWNNLCSSKFITLYSIVWLLCKIFLLITQYLSNEFITKLQTRKPVCFMQSWNCTSHFKSYLLLIWNSQMRLEMRCAIWNFWNFSNLSWRVAYLKLSDEAWNEMCYLKLLKLFKPIMEGCLFETFRWDLKWDVLFETFETWNFWNFSTHHRSCLFETFRWDLNEICYLKLFETWNFSTHHRSFLFETFRWDLKWDMLFETFEIIETWNCLNMWWELLISNFQMRLDKRCDIRNIWNFSNLKLCSVL